MSITSTRIENAERGEQEHAEDEARPVDAASGELLWTIRSAASPPDADG